MLVKSICLGVQHQQRNKVQTIAGASIIMLIMQTADFAWCNKFIDTFPTSLLTRFANFSPFYEWFEDESWLIKDKRKHRGAVDKRFSEQQFHKSDAITFVVQKF